MSKFSYDAEIKEIVDRILLEIPEVESGNAFGLPGYFVNGKLFACVFESGLTLKLPKEKCDDLKQNYDGFDSFTPLGRTMKEWIHMTKDNPESFEEEIDLITQSINFVREMTKK